MAGHHSHHVHGVDRPDGTGLAAARAGVVPHLERGLLGGHAPRLWHAAHGLELGRLVLHGAHHAQRDEALGGEGLPSEQALASAGQVPDLLVLDRVGAHRVQHGVEHLAAVAAQSGIVGDFDQLVAAGGAALQRIGESLAGI